MASVLIVDDLLSIHEMLEAVIQPTGFATAFATDGEKALARYKSEKFDIVLADIDMKPMDGITLLKQLKIYDPKSVIIIMTAYASTESAIQALKFGAFDYLQKPFRVDELIQTLKRALEFKQFNIDRPNQPVPTAKAGDVDTAIIGRSEQTKRLIQQVKKLLGARTPVLITGETGTGKKLVAELLHTGSNPPESPFVGIDCALSSGESFREGLLGENGTGGEWIQNAKGGTLFLQHIQSLPLEIQGEVVSVLRNNSHSFRLICSSSEDLEKLTDEGAFNDELFYRVASLPLSLPPLRERTEDLPLLVKHYAAQTSNPNFESNQIEFTEDAMAKLCAYRWPGNLTELQQVISKVVSTTESRVITYEQLPVRLHDVKDWPSLAEYLAGQEKQYLETVLQACRGDKQLAAEILKCDLARLG